MFRFPKDQQRWTVLALIGAVPLLAIAALGAFLLWQGTDALGHLASAVFTEHDWLPVKGAFGITALLLGTTATSLLALGLALPIGLGAAIYLAQHAPPRLRALGDAAVGLLGGMPSVIIGLWGMTWITPVFGNTLTSAFLVLAVMITPTLTLLAGSALRQVPAEVAETARALGAGENLVTWVLVRHAWRGLAGASILAVSRALGEAVALSMVAGNIPALPRLDGPISTLTTTLIIEFEGSVGDHRAALYLLAFMVMLLIAAFSLAGRYTHVEERP